MIKKEAELEISKIVHSVMKDLKKLSIKYEYSFIQLLNEFEIEFNIVSLGEYPLYQEDER